MVEIVRPGGSWSEICMPTTAGDAFLPDFRGRPPHMSEEDFAIWQRWWPFNRAGVTRMWFDVGLGMPDELPETPDAAGLGGWIRINQKRVDVVIDREGVIEIVELRAGATLNAVGRLLGYGLLWGDDPVVPGPVKLILVTDRRDAEVERLAVRSGIRYVVA